ncbi:MAG: hypothetical protein EZS28_040548, partial [Streblomastix strix]
TVTGSCLDLNKMKDNQLVILDFDIPHDQDEYNKEFYRKVIINDHLPKGTPVLITAHGGLHAYVHRYDYPLKSNRLVASKKIPFTGFTVDIFAQIEKHKTADGKPNGIKENRVMLPDSVIRDKGQEYKYPTAPANFWGSNNLPNLWDILAAWNVDLNEEYVKEPRFIQSGVNVNISLDLAF